MQKALVCFSPAVRVIQAVVVDHVKMAFSKSARHQQTFMVEVCNHAYKQAAHQRNLLIFETIYIVRVLVP
jgi:hypothetical protein